MRRNEAYFVYAAVKKDAALLNRQYPDFLQDRIKGADNGIQAFIGG